MHRLPCPQCQTEISVTPSQAGDTAICPKCQTAVAIPKLGELRQLPRVEEEQAGAAASPRPVEEPARPQQVAFVLAGLIVAAGLLVAGFCGLRWALVEVSGTSDEHIATIRQELSTRTAAELVREYEDMESRSLELGLPFKYKDMAITKARWGRNASIALGVTIVALLAAVGFARKGKRKHP